MSDFTLFASYLVVGAVVGAMTYYLRGMSNAQCDVLWLHIVIGMTTWPLLLLALVITPIIWIWGHYTRPVSEPSLAIEIKHLLEQLRRNRHG
jgi:hypothetical protein